MQNDATEASAADFDAFVLTHGRRLLRVAVALTHDLQDGEDLLQQALVKVYLKWDRIDSSADAYARRVILREFLNSRRRRRLSQVSLDRSSDIAAGDTDPGQSIDLFAALRKLPSRQRAVVVCRYMEDLPLEEIAVLMDCSIGTVKSQLFKARERLRVIFEEGGYGRR